ncbi:hypothetical protein BGY98DRAFT_59115 [Russula aff. rugulosa BPL654]|nr:hypothetical protein BGY98DRAFT_59115 [Russula aff. rugulosa BPL654]
MLSQGQTSRSVNFVFHHRSQSIRTPLQLTRNVRHIIITRFSRTNCQPNFHQPCGPPHLSPPCTCLPRIHSTFVAVMFRVGHSFRDKHQHAIQSTQGLSAAAPRKGTNCACSGEFHHHLNGRVRPSKFLWPGQGQQPSEAHSGTSLAQYWRPPTRVKFDPLLMPTARASDGVRTVS